MELLVKVLDARGINGNYWAFSGALSDLGYEITVVDTETDRGITWWNTPGALTSFADTGRLPNLGATETVSFADVPRTAGPGPWSTSRNDPACPDEALCLQGGRFEVRVLVEGPGGGRFGARPSPLTGETGAFWFTEDINLELLVKVLDARSINGHFWVFFGGLSDLGYQVTVTDTATDTSKTYENHAGQLASRADTQAFASP